MIARFALLSAGLLAGFVGSAQAADQPAENVCLVTYAYARHAIAKDPSGITAASYMPRETAAKIVSDYSRIFDYADAATTLRACRCLANPWPANNLTEREQAIKACPAPTRIE